MTLYLGKRDGLQRVFDRQVLDDLSITVVDSETRIESSFHHGSCNNKRATCRLAWGLDPSVNRLVPRPSINGDLFSSEPEEGPIDGSWDGHVSSN